MPVNTIMIERYLFGYWSQSKASVQLYKTLSLRQQRLNNIVKGPVYYLWIKVLMLSPLTKTNVVSLVINQSKCL